MNDDGFEKSPKSRAVSPALVTQWNAKDLSVG